jgi:signal transduction histidine kinase
LVCRGIWAGERHQYEIISARTLATATRPAETALFRIMPEALTNVHRHCGSRAVEISLTIDDSNAMLKVKDFGKEVPKDVLNRCREKGTTGVGLAGIRERLTELGGFLEIESSPQGTVLKATIPVNNQKGRQPADTAFHPSPFFATVPPG